MCGIERVGPRDPVLGEGLGEVVGVVGAGELGAAGACGGDGEGASELVVIKTRVGETVGFVVAVALGAAGVLGLTGTAGGGVVCFGLDPGFVLTVPRF
jgi:hypothetical protein